MEKLVDSLTDENKKYKQLIVQLNDKLQTYEYDHASNGKQLAKIDRKIKQLKEELNESRIRAEKYQIKCETLESVLQNFNLTVENNHRMYQGSYTTPVQDEKRNKYSFNDSTCSPTTCTSIKHKSTSNVHQAVDDCSFSISPSYSSSGNLSRENSARSMLRH